MNTYRAKIGYFIVISVYFVLVFLFSAVTFSFASDKGLKLQDLIDEALKNNPEILASEQKSLASGFRIPQATSLPDPMFMFGYQNEGFEKYTYGKSEDAQWMFSASQMLPYPGKLALKGEMATKDQEAVKESYRDLRLKIEARIRELYYDLFLSYRTIDILKDKELLFSRIEDAAVARYSSGMGLQQEVLMAQTERYMLLEKEEMQRQRIQSGEAMLNSVVGRDVNTPLGRPADVEATVLTTELQVMLNRDIEMSPMVQEKQKMIEAARAKVRMTEKEYYPDFTINAGYFNRGGGMDDMWSLTTTVNIPIFYRTKQRQAVNEAKAQESQAMQELNGTKLMLSSAVRDNYTMMKTAERLMSLYQDGLIPKTHQDFEAALAGYVSGKIEAITVISRLKVLLDYEMLYWTQFIEREKAIARLNAVAGIQKIGGEER